MKYAFITGMGRSGTKFLSNLLALDQNIYAFHEYFGHREYWLLSWYIGKSYTTVFLKNKKNKETKYIDKTLFVDVNSYLSSSVDSLNEVFKNPKIFHLVRNPKKVVPSIMTRRDDGRMHKIPKTASEIEKWIGMSKLEQVCTNWVKTTENLLNSDAILIKFEDLTTDFNYVEQNLLIPLQINISKNQFEEFKTKKINKTRGKLYRYLYAKYKGKSFVNNNFTYEDFNLEEVNVFNKICGETMSKLGYK